MNPDKEIKPSEYFKHLLVYKDGRFARHRRWRYFALNSLMRRRASSEEEGQLTVDDTRFNAKRYSHSKVLRYDERLRSTIQYWMRRRAVELN
ncbi:hypothetical protein RhiirA5_417048 [Rhizophagus irregularis]|uniref:Uncharacterized protein n=1 Tax=Rhizophagus irregularis TaxID=588596 RepID=A0A2N0PNF6_9GLOM|nr:hypothetical protein RhiirA5_417048 [Rhizophagus irregularis]